MNAGPDLLKKTISSRRMVDFPPGASFESPALVNSVTWLFLGNPIKRHTLLLRSYTSDLQNLSHEAQAIKVRVEFFFFLKVKAIKILSKQDNPRKNNSNNSKITLKKTNSPKPS